MSQNCQSFEKPPICKEAFAVNVELREKLILEIEQCILCAGAESYEEGMQQFAKVLAFLQKTYDPMRTKEQLRAFFDQMPEPSWKEKLFINGGFKYLPQVIHYALKQLSILADETLPPLPLGRHGLDLQTKKQIIAHVARQHIKGYSLELAKKSAARRFAVSEATVQRTWDDRGSLGEADLRFVVKFLTDGADSSEG